MVLQAGDHRHEPSRVAPDVDVENAAAIELGGLPGDSEDAIGRREFFRFGPAGFAGELLQHDPFSRLHGLGLWALGSRLWAPGFAETLKAKAQSLTPATRFPLPASP